MSELMVVATDGPDRLLVRRGDEAAVFTDDGFTEFQDLQIWFKWAVWDEVEPYPFDEAQVAKGGAGSGNFGHTGRPGAVGGSASTKVPAGFADHMQSLGSRFGVAAKFKVVDSVVDYYAGTKYESYVGRDTQAVHNPEANEVVFGANFLGGEADSGVELSADLKYTASAGWQLLATHEYAHQYDATKGEPSLGGAWKKISTKYVDDHDIDWDDEGNTIIQNSDTCISKYSRKAFGITGYKESFAEAFAAYVHRPQWLQRTNPDMHEFMSNLETTKASQATTWPGLLEVWDGVDLKWVGPAQKLLPSVEIKADISELAAALEEWLVKGGSGSGNWGHSGRPGRRGGSSSGRRGRRTTEAAGSKRTRFTGTFKPRGSRRGERIAGPESEKRPGGAKPTEPEPETVEIPGGAKVVLGPGEQVVDIGGGVKLPQGMVVTPEAPYGYRQSASGEPLVPRTGQGETGPSKRAFSPDVSLEDRVKQGIRALLGESEMMTPNQRRQMTGIANNVLRRLEQAERSAKRNELERTGRRRRRRRG